MKKEEFKLIEKREGLKYILKELGISNVIIEVVLTHIKQVDKEFIKRLKELNFNKRRFRVINDIDKLTGDLK